MVVGITTRTRSVVTGGGMGAITAGADTGVVTTVSTVLGAETTRTMVAEGMTLAEAVAIVVVAESLGPVNVVVKGEQLPDEEGRPAPGVGLRWRCSGRRVPTTQAKERTA
jgi:hypothetical protein